MAVEAWFTQQCVVTMERKSASATSSITGQVTSFSESAGGKDVESIPVFGGGSIVKEMRTEPTEVSFDVIPTDLTFFEPMYGAKTTETVLVVKSTETARDDYRITVTWAEGFNSASPKVPNSGQGLRFTFINANAVSLEPSQDADAELTATITFKVPPTDSSANPQIIREYTANAATTPFPNPYGTSGSRQAYSSYT